MFVYEVISPLINMPYHLPILSMISIMCTACFSSFYWCAIKFNMNELLYDQYILLKMTSHHDLIFIKKENFVMKILQECNDS